MICMRPPSFLPRLTSFVMLLCLGGCATVTAEDTQGIAVTTEPAGAACTLTNKVGSWKIAATPATATATATVQRSFSPLKIECQKGTLSATQSLEPFTRGRAYGNILLLGIPAYVDAATGAGYEYRPESVTLKLTPTSVSPAPPPKR